MIIDQFLHSAHLRWVFMGPCMLKQPSQSRGPIQNPLGDLPKSANASTSPKQQRPRNDRQLHTQILTAPEKDAWVLALRVDNVGKHWANWTKLAKLTAQPTDHRSNFCLLLMSPKVTKLFLCIKCQRSQPNRRYLEVHMQ